MYLLIVLNDVREFLVFEGQHYFVVHGTIPDPRLEARLPLQGASSSSSLLSSSGTTYATCAREPIVATYRVTRLRLHSFANCLIARRFGSVWLILAQFGYFWQSLAQLGLV